MLRAMSTRSILGLMYTAQALQQLGEDIAPVLARQGLALDRLDPGARIDRAVELRIYTEIAESLRDPLAGLKSGRSFGFAGYGPLSMLLITCARGLDAIRTGIHYQELTYLYCGLDFTPGERASALVLAPPALPQRAFRFRIDGEMAGTFKLLRDIQTTLGVQIKPERVDMPYPRPSEAETYEAQFGCPVRFGETQARFWFHNDDLQRPFPTHDPTAQALYRRLCDEQLLAQQCDLSSLAQRVLLHLELHEARPPDAAGIARLFGLSERSLRRHLSAENTSLRALVGQVRYRKARLLLEQTPHSVEAIAGQLGYAEPAAFIHAFRRWSGRSPLAFRSAARRAAGDAQR